MGQFLKEAKNRIVRGAKRAVYDKRQVFEILDDGFICHVGFNMVNQPFMIPTAYAREGETIYIHGSIKSRLIQQAAYGIPLCVSVTHLDGLVLARSAFHHSVNYRSVIAYGNAEVVKDDAEKVRVLELITEQMLTGRWGEVRQPNQKELDMTRVLAIRIKSAAAKVRVGGPVDEKEDYNLDLWAGVIPVKINYGKPLPDDSLSAGIDVSHSAQLAWERGSQ